jgi:hypothetical protein
LYKVEIVIIIYYGLEDLLPNVLLACVVEVTVVSGGKILALLGVLLLLLPLIADAFNCLLCILMNSRVACVGTLDNLNAVLERGTRVRSATPVAT